jgi:hypothetical protein
MMNPRPRPTLDEVKTALGTLQTYIQAFDYQEHQYPFMLDRCRDQLTELRSAIVEITVFEHRDSVEELPAA